MLIKKLEAFFDTNGKARASALRTMGELDNPGAPTVSYESCGHLLIIGDHTTTTGLVSHFTCLKTVTLLSTDNTSATEIKSDNLYHSSQVTVSGYLGAFEVSCAVEQLIVGKVNLSQLAIGQDSFDLILDLTPNGVMSEEVPVPGYYSVGNGKSKLVDAIEQLPEMVGTFDKPKYFHFDSDLCAHSSRELAGCDHCVLACPAGALTSNGRAISINPNLCQGIGACTTACPTGAISYAIPDSDHVHFGVVQLLESYAGAGGNNPVVLFYGNDEQAHIADAMSWLPSNVIPVQLEALASVGIDTWLSVLAYGAQQVLLACSSCLPDTINRVINQELEIAQHLLKEMGQDGERIKRIDLSARGLARDVLFTDAIAPATKLLTGGKRDKLFAALHQLYLASPKQPEFSMMPGDAPFGRVSCATEDCTLCMSCVAVCPTRALHTMGDRPGLLFIEQDCVQCGLCEKACPEQVISLEPGFSWKPENRQNPVVLFEEEAARCTCCDKPFAPLSMVNMLIEKLANHIQFEGDAIRRLSMCEDCRVRDVFTQINHAPESQLHL